MPTLTASGMVTLAAVAGIEPVASALAAGEVDFLAVSAAKPMAGNTSKTRNGTDFFMGLW
jgi:hypothetical protein